MSGAGPDPVRVAIVTPVHNRRELTLGCLRSIAQMSAPGLAIHTIVVDDGSSDGTAAAIAAAHPDVEVVQGDGTLWYTEGTNVGIRRALASNADFVLLINDDQVFDPACLRHLVATAQAQPRSVVGPLLVLWDTPDRLFQTAPVWDTWRGGWRHWHHQTVATVPDDPWTVELIVGNCVLVPAQAIHECGEMDARRFPNFGDAEFTPRLRRAGWQLVVEPRARVYCQPNTPPARARSLSWRRRWHALVIDTRQPHNLRRRFHAYWHGAPSPLHGVVAFVLFFVRWAMGVNVEGAWGASQQEPPLRETFAAHRLSRRRRSDASPRPRRVVYAWNYVEWGGAQIYFLALMREAMTLAEVSVLLPTGSHPQLLAALDGLGVPYEQAFPAIDAQPARTLRRKLAIHRAKLASEWAMLRALRRHVGSDAAVLHVDLAPWQSMVALWRLSRLAPTFVTCHNALPRQPWWREALWWIKLRLLARCVRLRLFTSNLDARASLARYLPPHAVARTSVASTGVDPQLFQAVRDEPLDVAAVRRRVALPPRTFLVACVGQFVDRKGRWTLLEAARAIAVTHRDIGFVWVSNSSPSADDLARVQSYGLGDAFHLLTSTDIGDDRRELFRLLRCADVFCLPTFVDGLPSALLEAMALGLPAISTPVFAIPEAISDGETGLLVAPGDPAALAQAILRLHGDSGLRARLATAGRAHVIARFDERRSARIACDAYAAAAGW